MAKQSAFMKQLQLAQDRREQEVRHHAKIFMLDLVTLTLGRMGWREKRFEEFDKVLGEVSMEYATDILKDYEDDKELWLSKATIDRELKQYVGGRFVPYDERYK